MMSKVPMIYYFFPRMQENNAIAQVDLLDEGVIEYIHALGTKSWENYFMDPSDMDGGKGKKQFLVRWH